MDEVSSRQQWFPAPAVRRALLPQVDELCDELAQAFEAPTTEASTAIDDSMSSATPLLPTSVTAAPDDPTAAQLLAPPTTLELAFATGSYPPARDLVPPPPRSCDTFVFVAGEGGPSGTLFGKNSDRPSDEEHEVVVFPAASHAPGSMVRCTYISIAQAEQTLRVVLSRPRWLWGCEMGANELGVVGGNEAVGTALAPDLDAGPTPRLLGMDLLRLALERGRSAHEAAQVRLAPAAPRRVNAPRSP
jgi:hypothetical protein